MNLNKIRPKNKTKDLLLSLTKNCETPNKQTHRQAEETLEFNFTKRRETFLLNPSISLEGSWMNGLTNPEVYNSIFTITEENYKFEHFTFPVSKIDGISEEKVSNEIVKNLDIS